MPNIVQNSYATLNPNLLFDDEDYHLEILSVMNLPRLLNEGNKEIILDNPDWINLSYKTTSKADAKRNFNRTSILYRR